MVHAMMVQSGITTARCFTLPWYFYHVVDLKPHSTMPWYSTVVQGGITTAWCFTFTIVFLSRGRTKIPWCSTVMQGGITTVWCFTLPWYFYHVVDPKFYGALLWYSTMVHCYGTFLVGQ